jgi:hypothetical protein
MMHVPIDIQIQTRDVGATQRAEFYINGQSLIAYKTQTGHDDKSLYYAVEEFGTFLAKAFGAHLREEGYTIDQNFGLYLKANNFEIPELPKRFWNE